MRTDTVLRTAYTIPAPPPEGLDRAALEAEAVAYLQALIRLDTRNPPGNERPAAEYLESVFRQAPGCETHVLDAGPGRANFVARLRAARPAARPVLVMGHTDVVGVEPERWTSPPFGAQLEDGYVYGRGAIDDKGMLSAAAAAILALARDQAAGRPLRRDVVLLATAAEEGGDPVGIQRVLEHHRDLVGDAEFALNEGGRFRVDGDRIASASIQTTEKVPYNVRVLARGPTGHASIPVPDNALAALARALARVHEWQAPVRLNETTRLYFRQLARIEPDVELRRAFLDVESDDSAARAAAHDRLSREPAHNAVLRTALSLTLVSGGIRANIIPSEGRATLNVRALPGDGIEEILRELKRVAGEEQVDFVYDGPARPNPEPSPVGTEFYRALEAVASEMVPGIVAMPYMSAGATDSAEVRAAGIPTYGLLLMPLTTDDTRRMHGHDERVPTAALAWGAEFLYRVLDRVARAAGA